MAEYISKQDVIDYLNGYLHSLGEDADTLFNRGQRRALTNSIQDILAVKAAKIQPVKRGKWEGEHYNELIECYEANCSECGYESTDKYRITDNHRYCEYCGTRMIKDGDTK